MRFFENIFPIILIILQLAAGAVDAFHGKWITAVYWIAAAVLNICVILK